jgi:dihydroflavonol-4-reductase
MDHKKILILGATGFIGGHIARCALKKDWEVFGLRRDETKFGHLEGFPLHWIKGDLMDFDSLRTAMRGIDVVFHAAGYYPKVGNPRLVPDQITQAEREILNVLNAADDVGIGKMVYTSSLTTIGNPNPKEKRLADERDFYRPGTLKKSAYYESKILMETTFLDFCKRGFPGVVLNPTAVFGPGDIYLTMAGLFIAIAKGMVVAWLPGSINVVDVRDVAEAHIAAVSRGKIGERYIIGGHNLTIREAISQAAAVAGVKSPRFEIPLWLLRGLITLGDIFPALPLPSNHLRAVHLWQGYNTQRAVNELGLSPRVYPETVGDSLSWLRTQGNL